MSSRAEALKETREELTLILDVLVRSRLPTCVTCVHFDKETELCQLAASRPPAVVIAFGCPEWEEPRPF